MSFMEYLPHLWLADASTAASVMRSYVAPTVVTLCSLASLACVFFLVNGGISYMTSSGNPEKLERAKTIVKNALIGLALVLAAGTLTAILSHAYMSSGGAAVEKLPTLSPITPDKPSDLASVLMDAIIGLFRNVIGSIGQPFVQALSYFTSSTPLMGENPSVFNLWLAVTGIADTLFVVVVALRGFHIMSFATFGFDDVEIKHLLPQLALIFMLMNFSLFAIDMVISLSNGMIAAMQSAFSTTALWDALINITKQSIDLGLAGLLVMTAFLVLTVMLLVYYVGRLITLYIGAILSPLVLLVWLIPPFKDFAITALKTYVTTIFVLFVHVVILLLAASIFSGMVAGDASGQPNALMALIVGLATILALLKAQGVMAELSYAASAPRAARQMAGSFMRGVSYMSAAGRTVGRAAGSTRTAVVKTSEFGNKTFRKPATADAAAASVSGGGKGGTTSVGQRSPRPGTGVVVTRKAAPIAPLKTGETRKAEKVGKK
jgi:hypothetical protein